jgi:hypothetical protein
MESIEKHIEQDKKILEDLTISSQQRRHIEGELKGLESYHERHPEDHYDPTSLELYCDTNPDAPECKIFDD